MANSTSHGGHNAIVPGAFGNGYAEHQVVRTIDSKVRAITGALNATDDIGGTVNANLVNIVNKMNQRPTDFHLSHHLNAYNGQAHGVEVWYYGGDIEAGKMAARISQAIANTLGITNRGAKATTSLYVISQSRGRALLIEWCFIDNANDMAKFMPNMDKAISAVLACLGYGSSSAPTPSNPVTPAQTSGYTVEAWNKRQVVDVNGLRIRAAQDTRSSVVGALNSGQTFTATRLCRNGEKVNGYTTWFEVNGRGWVSGAYVTPI